MSADAEDISGCESIKLSEPRSVAQRRVYGKTSQYQALCHSVEAKRRLIKFGSAFPQRNNKNYASTLKETKDPKLFDTKIDKHE